MGHRLAVQHNILGAQKEQTQRKRTFSELMADSFPKMIQDTSLKSSTSGTLQEGQTQGYPRCDTAVSIVQAARANQVMA